MPPKAPRKVGSEERWLWDAEANGLGEEVDEARVALGVGYDDASVETTVGLTGALDVAVVESRDVGVEAAAATEVTVGCGSPLVVNIESDTAAVEALLVTIVVNIVLELVVGDIEAAVDAGLDAGVKMKEQFFEKTTAMSPLERVTGVLISVHISVVFPPNL